MTVRLLASDVDGTIVGPAGTVTPRTAAALAAARAAGVAVALVTGRPLRWVPAVVDALGGVDGVVTSNGALVLRLPGGHLDGGEEVLARATIPAADVLDWAGRLREAVPGVALGVERPAGFGAEPGYPVAPGVPGVSVAPLPDLLARDATVLKLLAKVPDAGVARLLPGPLPGDALLALARRALAGRVVPVHSDSRRALVEIGPAGVDKATGLAVLCDALGVAAGEVMAFGDMPNDVAMLTWAGRGVAMGDGHPEAVAAADAVAGTCADDGVARAVEDLLADLRAVVPRR